MGIQKYLVLKIKQFFSRNYLVLLYTVYVYIHVVIRKIMICSNLYVNIYQFTL